MTANKVVYIAIKKNTAFSSVSFQSPESSENIWENGMLHHHCACRMLSFSEGNKLSFSVTKDFYISLKLFKLLCKGRVF